MIGMLLSGSRASSEHVLRAFRQGLREGGYAEGRNVAVEYRWAEDRNARFPQLAAELVQRGVNVIAAVGSPAVAAAKAATATIPIVFYVGVDPVSFGLVNSLNRPGGNLTGVTNFSLETGPKRLELLAELLGPGKVVGVLLNPRRPRSETKSTICCKQPRRLDFRPMSSMPALTRSSRLRLRVSLVWELAGSPSAAIHSLTSAPSTSGRFR